MAPQAPWSPTAHAFAHHQFSQVTNFWKQGRQASFRLEALPGGQAELSLTFQLPSATEVIPPPVHVSPAPVHQRPIHPLFPRGCFPQRSDLKSKPIPPKVASRKQRKNYQRSVLHRAALAAASTTLPPPKPGSLRQAASACVQRLQADPVLQVNNQNAKKRPLDSTTALSPSNISPLAQRIRADFQIGESEGESPDKELLRSSPCPEHFPPPISPCMKGFPPPAPLVFTPAHEKAVVLAVSPATEGSGPVPPEKSRCLNCEAEMTPEHQCEAKDSGAFPPDSVSYTPPGSPKRTIGRRIFPKKFVKEAATDEHSRVKCCVCACLGRKTSMVLLGSKCPSCGITATDN